MGLDGTESYKHIGWLEASGLNLGLETDFPDWNVRDYPGTPDKIRNCDLRVSRGAVSSVTLFALIIL
jgi:hypothetical protein